MSWLRRGLARMRPLLVRLGRVPTWTKPQLARVGRMLEWMAPRVDLFLVVVAVGVISWAAFDIGSIVGRIVTGLGLLFLGGGIGKFVRELHGG